MKNVPFKKKTNLPITNTRRSVESWAHVERSNRQNETSHKIKLSKNKNSQKKHRERCIQYWRLQTLTLTPTASSSTWSYMLVCYRVLNTHIALCRYSCWCYVIYDYRQRLSYPYPNLYHGMDMSMTHFIY